ncbi:MAG: M23 family metallopeptidase [Vicinamibacterales bacterium]|jgi:murein DD-endopeptidase MepM/ murein hydrolase activator NlpD|nr:M23 family metallopeptidase [Vicinamibacterales bacterium]
MPSIWSRRFTVVFVDRTSGVGRRATIHLGWTLATVAFLFSVPVLVGLGIRWATVAEIDSLRASVATLGAENANFKGATGELATQIVSLQGVIDELAVRANLDPAAARAMQKLPAVIKNRAMGGDETAPRRSAMVAAALAAPEDTFGLLRDALGRLELGLRSVRTDVERREALAAATPSIWPTVGWVSSWFGHRQDPFTGDRGQHYALDISADKGSPVVATADGVIESAEWNGNYGNLLVIDHGFGITTRYGHLAGFAAKAGTRVRRGDLVGYVGATGRATGPHLHFEILANGQLIDPVGYLGTVR